MAQHQIEMESDSSTQLCCPQKHSTRDWHACRNLTRAECCFAHDKLRYEIESPEKRQRRKSKSQQQHCPSCHCSLEAVNHSIGRVKYPDNVEALIERYEDFLVDPLQTTKKSLNSFASKSYPCSHVRTNAYHHAKKRQSSSHRYQQGNRGQGFSTIRDDFINSMNNDNTDGCCGYEHTAKNEYRKDAPWKNYNMLVGASRNSNVDSNVPIRCDYYNKKERTRNPQSRISRQPVQKSNRITRNEKNDSDNDNIGWDEEFRQLGLSKNIDLENTDQEREEQAIEKPNALPSKLSTVRSCSTKANDPQTLSKSKNTEDLTKLKALPDDISDYAKDEDSRKGEIENISFCKPSKRSIVPRSSACRPDESPTGRECMREAMHCEVIVNDDDQETGKNIFAAGDLDLHATKNHILGVIDRAICKEFGNTPDQQKDADSNRELTSREIYIEITRALQGDCCLWRLGDRDSKDKYIGMLKTIRSDHLNHIQDEIKKLCNLQKFLDACSPRLSSSMSQSHSGIVERPEERQQHDDKHSLGPTL